MISSMTGFFFGEQDTKFGNLVIEIRTLNSRYFELQLKLSDELRIYESQIRELILAKISRGKIDCRVYLRPNEVGFNTKKIDANEIKLLIQSVEKIAGHIKNPALIDPIEIMKLLGTVKEGVDSRYISKIILTTFPRAIQKIIADRQREGGNISKVILNNAKAIEKLINQTKKIMPTAIKIHQGKIQKKFKEALIDIEGDRLKQELLIFIQKSDVTEEIDRLESHLKELKRLLTVKEPVGKKMDFLMQEFNREANTLGSKAISVDISQISVELKVLIEQIREQIQNIE
ncbi:MAG: YicC family protein [Proteobacteria bacterium]|nr:YicC family protein [Pseudomonadota bacterium]